MEFTLRPWLISDAKSLVKNANNFNIAKFVCHIPFPYTIKDAENFLTMAVQKSDNFFCIEVDNEAIGGIGIHPQQNVHCKNAEIGYWLAEPFWSQGIISNAIPKIVAYGFEKFDINRIHATVFGNNLASQRVLEKSGFILEAHLHKTIFKNNEYLDELIYAIRK